MSLAGDVGFLEYRDELRCTAKLHHMPDWARKGEKKSRDGRYGSHRTSLVCRPATSKSASPSCCASVCLPACLPARLPHHRRWSSGLASIVTCIHHRRYEMIVRRASRILGKFLIQDAHTQDLSRHRLLTRRSIYSTPCTRSVGKIAPSCYQPEPSGVSTPDFLIAAHQTRPAGQ